MQPDASKFPEGMAALVSYIHSRGLRAGICECRNCLPAVRPR